MRGEDQNKLEKLLEAVPSGFLVDSSWLAHNGIGRRSSNACFQRGWLERLDRSVFRRHAPVGVARDRPVLWRTSGASWRQSQIAGFLPESYETLQHKANTIPAFSRKFRSLVVVQSRRRMRVCIPDRIQRKKIIK